MYNDFIIDHGILSKYTGKETHVVIPDVVTLIGEEAFMGCENLISVTISNSVIEIGEGAFNYCKNLTSVSIPDSVTIIRNTAFGFCSSLAYVFIPNSVTILEGNILYRSFSATVICCEGSCAHKYCLDQQIAFIFDYQYEAFNGVIPPGSETLASPFQADEEKPFIFISYSHKDRDEVLVILKALYESGWKIWYDEGLTIGYQYDKTLKAHIKSCSAFLLFVTKNSLKSKYIKSNEIPWAIEFKKPIIKCILGEDNDYPISGGHIAAIVTPNEIETTLKKVEELIKGKPRVAKGISVVVNPADRQISNGSGFAYCLYSKASAAISKSILHEAVYRGCNIYNAVENGEDEKKLQACSCLIVFLDHSFLLDEHLSKILTKKFNDGKDIAVCQLERIVDDDLPTELKALHKLHWLHFINKITADTNTKLAQYLQQMGCRNTRILPGFEHKETENGIVIKRYTGTNTNLIIMSDFGSIPVTKIASRAFKNCIHIKSIDIPDSVNVIDSRAFMCCTSLESVTIPNSLKVIGESAFLECTSLTSVTIPGSVKTIGDSAFFECSSLSSVTILDGVETIGSHAFYGCTSLTHITIPSSVKEIGSHAFYGCTGLVSVEIPNSVKKMGWPVFFNCPKATIICSYKSYAWKYCVNHNYSVKVPNTDKSEHTRRGFFGRLLGKK